MGKKTNYEDYSLNTKITRIFAPTAIHDPGSALICAKRDRGLVSVWFLPNLSNDKKGNTPNRLARDICYGGDFSPPLKGTFGRRPFLRLKAWL